MSHYGELHCCISHFSLMVMLKTNWLKWSESHWTKSHSSQSHWNKSLCGKSYCGISHFRWTTKFQTTCNNATSHIAASLIRRQITLSWRIKLIHLMKHVRWIILYLLWDYKVGFLLFVLSGYDTCSNNAQKFCLPVIFIVVFVPMYYFYWLCI